MCEAFSAIVTSDNGVISEVTTNSHEVLIRRYGLDDTVELHRRQFVRVEDVPIDNGWIFTVDEEGTLPDWFDREKAERMVRRVSQRRLMGLRNKCAPQEDFSGMNLAGIDLSEADLRGVGFCRTILRGATLRGADLRGANLYGADLRGANLYGADLRGANLRGANLYGADLRGADLRGADLRGATLRGADLRGANLYGADLRGANLYGADLRRANLYGALYDAFTSFPEGFSKEGLVKC